MMLNIPKGYSAILDLNQTEKAIKLVKDFVEQNLASELKLRRLTAPFVVKKGIGVNDDLNGVERPVEFSVRSLNDQKGEVVQSLAKWKRMVLADYKIEQGYGIYTDMNALRPDEELDNTHSIYVDQWDWERVISEKERNLESLKEIVRKVYSVLRRSEYIIYESYPQIKPQLPNEITFFHSEEMLKMYPGLPPREREFKLAQKYGAIFVIGIGAKLSNGERHDGRAPDYDDWSSPTIGGNRGLNGDIIIWNPVLKDSFEISSMGIRVNPEVLSLQLKLTGTENRKDLYWHKRLLNSEFPLSIGGGIGQSRICMYFLRKAHIGEVQASIWPDEMIKECIENNIFLM
jgi:aspartate--ammonia ligase